MNFDSLVRYAGRLPWFDLATLVQLSGERRATIIHHLYRLAKAGRVLPLRRGLYTLAEPYRKAPLPLAALANATYRPSYLSCEWALSYHGLIPEGVPRYTSVTSRVPRRFANALGEFTYRHIKRDLFGGYDVVVIADARALVASPHKALFDFLYLSKGEWTCERVQELRLDASGVLDLAKLETLAHGCGRPRIVRATSRVVAYLRQIDPGVAL